MRNRWKLGLAAAAVALSVAGTSGSAWAQAPAPAPGGTQPGQPGGRGNRGGNRGAYDPVKAREDALARIKEKLASPDDEWQILKPRIEKLMDAQRAGRDDSRFGGGGRTRGGAPGGAPGATAAPAAATPDPNARPLSPVGTASKELRAAIDDKATSAADLDKKLANLRAAKEKSKADFAAAQKDVREVVTRRQEAVLVTEGMLD